MKRLAIYFSGIFLLLVACQEEKYASHYNESDTTGDLTDLNAKTENRPPNSDRPPTVVKLSSPSMAEMACDTLNYFSDTTFADGRGDTLNVKTTFYCLNQPQRAPRIVAKERCRFEVKEEIIENFGLRIDVTRNGKLLFSRNYVKENFGGILDWKFIKYNVLAWAQLYAYIPKFQQFVFTISMAQRPGGTNWFAQVFVVMDIDGQTLNQGLVDYPHHCEDLMSMSTNQEYILTCSELNHLTGFKSKFSNASVAMAKFISDSVFTLVYDIYRDSLICDTLVYWKNDTVSYANYKSRRDTTQNNAFILTIRGDTLADFQFNGYTDGGEGYYTEYAHRKDLNMVAFFDYKKRYLRLFDGRYRFKEYGFKLGNLKEMPKTNKYRSFIQFYTKDNDGENCRIRFYLNGVNKIFGYSYIYG